MMAETTPSHTTQPEPGSRPGSAGAATEETPAAPEPKLPRVLVIDDEHAIRTTITKYLQRVGYDVEAFEKGSDLLRSIGERRADLVISDLFMPETDGVELLMALRKHADPPRVIVISGGNNYWSSSFNAAKQLGAVATLMKPFSLAELHAAVRSALPTSAQTAPQG